MDMSLCAGEITSEELKKRINIKIENYKKQWNEIKHLDFNFSNDNLESLLDELAYKYVSSGRLTDKKLNKEIETILKLYKENITTHEMLEESNYLDESVESNLENHSVHSPSYVNNSLNFNDTLEDLERALNGELLEDEQEFGDESLITEEHEFLDFNFSTFYEDNKVGSPASNITDSHKNNLPNSIESSVTPISNNKETKFYESGSSKICGNQESIPKSLRFPFCPVKQCAKFEMKSPLVKQNFKDVISPVAFYIKNSGLTPIKRNIIFSNTNEIKVNEVEGATSSNIEKYRVKKEKSLDLPQVYYKPANNVFVEEQEVVKMPKNIQSLVGITAEVIIHHKREGESSFYFKIPSTIV